MIINVRNIYSLKDEIKYITWFNFLLLSYHLSFVSKSQYHLFLFAARQYFLLYCMNNYSYTTRDDNNKRVSIQNFNKYLICNIILIRKYIIYSNIFMEVLFQFYSPIMGHIINLRIHLMGNFRNNSVFACGSHISPLPLYFLFLYKNKGLGDFFHFQILTRPFLTFT